MQTIIISVIIVYVMIASADYLQIFFFFKQRRFGFFTTLIESMWQFDKFRDGRGGEIKRLPKLIIFFSKGIELKWIVKKLSF